MQDFTLKKWPAMKKSTGCKGSPGHTITRLPSCRFHWFHGSSQMGSGSPLRTKSIGTGFQQIKILPFGILEVWFKTQGIITRFYLWWPWPSWPFGLGVPKALIKDIFGYHAVHDVFHGSCSWFYALLACSTSHPQSTTGLIPTKLDIPQEKPSPYEQVVTS